MVAVAFPGRRPGRCSGALELRRRSRLACRLAFHAARCSSARVRGMFSFIFYLWRPLQIWPRLGISALPPRRPPLWRRAAPGKRRSAPSPACAVPARGAHVAPSAFYANPPSSTETIDGNPDCWMAYNNTRVVYMDATQFDKAPASFQQGIGYHAPITHRPSRSRFTFHPHAGCRQ